MRCGVEDAESTCMFRSCPLDVAGAFDDQSSTCSVGEQSQMVQLDNRSKFGSKLVLDGDYGVILSVLKAPALIKPKA